MRAPKVLLALLLAACGDPWLAALPPDARAVSFRSLGPWNYTNMAASRRLVVTNRTDWVAVWAQIQGSHSPAAPLPAVDFGEEMVVVAAMGTRPTGGYRITIEHVAADSGTVYVDVLESSPGGSCVVTDALTQPVAAAIVAGAPFAAVRFVERSEKHDC